MNSGAEAGFVPSLTHTGAMATRGKAAVEAALAAMAAMAKGPTKEERTEVWNLKKLQGATITPTPPFHRLQQNVSWWQEWGTREVVNLICHGVGSEWKVPKLKASKEQKGNVEQAMSLIKDYQDNGVVSGLHSNSVVPYFISWFVIQKEELEIQK